ncbi:glycosyltransferase [Streptomyces sp. J2-1]|uniref:glycosyltransferase n=1 Tax=Streptomyces corallincola TaxID=2851888 RepID=UPI001C381F22|nr:glycosyltransferase [Streptomyces corallincola]MBV2357667.1 glycosyltransferase [Streptomyces corallincola]
MRISVSTAGSRGDFEPYVALAQGLIGAGHEVVFAAPRDARRLVAGTDAEFVEMDLEVREVFRSEEGQRWLAAGDAEAYLAGIARMLSQARHTVGASVLAAAEGADLLVTGVNTEDYALAVAQAHGTPIVLGHLTPWLLTDEFPQPLTPQAVPDGVPARQYHLETHRMAEEVYWQGKRDDIDEFRGSLGLPGAPSAALTWTVELGLPTLQAFSEQVVPRPRDWAPQNAVTGFWRLQPEVRERVGEAVVPGGLADWLADGPPPVFLGFGSMPVLDPAKLVDLIVRAAERTGLRLLVGVGWSDLSGLGDELPDGVRLVGAVDHDWLFPRCRAVVHHGGAGTTAAGLTAGLPTWIYTVFSDQPFWGDRVARLGVGGYASFQDFGLDHLVGVLGGLVAADVRERAAAVGARLRAEDGVGTAVGLIEKGVGAG